MTAHDGGKGDKLIPPQDKEQFDKNWDAIFNDKPESCIEYGIEADNDHLTILATIPFGR
jgi:hypothetical protein